MYYSLKCEVLRLNGETYKEHILIIFKDHLNEKDRKMAMNNEQASKKFLK